ncbi:MAG: hypothetical protein RL489_3028 [Pseudomonadota bacterium]|jgi:hypothetical protein
MNLLDTLTRAADEEQLRLRPLPEHAAAPQAEHLRRHYALLLAAVLTAQPTVSEPQTRLLRLLLDALKLGDIRGPLFEQARKLTPEPLLEAARLIREAGFARHLVLDSMVLLRLEAPLGDDTVRLVGELACFLDLSESELAWRAHDAADILGLHADETLKDTTEHDGPAAELAWERARLLANVWPNRLTQPLTADALRQGLKNSFYMLDADLEVDFSWSAENVTFLFRNGATLRTFGSNINIKISDCQLFNAALEIEGWHGTSHVTLERCKWHGNYDASAKVSTLKCRKTSLTVNECSFVTLNARTIRAESQGLTVKNSLFTHCGHADLYGGAIWHCQEEFLIEDCRFDRCIAAIGGALRLKNMSYNTIKKCHFLNCSSKEIIQGLEPGESTIAILSNSTTNKSVHNCQFTSSSVLTINSEDYSAQECYFTKSNFYCKARQQQQQQQQPQQQYIYVKAKATWASEFNEGNEIWVSQNNKKLNEIGSENYNVLDEE